MFPSATSPNDTHWTSVYLCEYAAQSRFRRTVNRLLVRAESVHQLERAIHYGPIRADRGRRRKELFLISGALGSAAKRSLS